MPKTLLSIKNHTLEMQVLRSIHALKNEHIGQIFNHSDTPFNTFAFLANLEDSGCVNESSGWCPKYHLLSQDSHVLGLMICFEKLHSYGEYVFDWAWAQAYHQHGIEYYPKLLCAIPFTPVPCKKWLGDERFEEVEIFAAIAEHYRQTQTYSGMHLNFPLTQPTLDTYPQLMSREGSQFHWFNSPYLHGNGVTESLATKHFADFDDYLSTMTARKRKAVKKERRQVAELGVTCQWKKGQHVTKADSAKFYHFYQMTYAKRGQTGYLTQAFFDALFEQQSEQIRLLVCTFDEDIVATALYFVDEETLYGRYWGSNQQFDLLHFEACYYQGIEYCIKHGLRCFNPGTQGEHKISRGFQPTLTYSYHTIYLDPFQQAIAKFCQDEKQYNRAYMAQCAEKLPFKLNQQ